MKVWVILRDDGHYYLGVMDGNALFGHGENAAVFKEKDVAERRMASLSRADEGRGFEVMEEEK